MKPVSSSIAQQSPSDPFYEYYKTESVTPHAVQRFRAIRDMIVRLHPDILKKPCNVADVGCGAGTQSRLWADLGCTVHGLDVNQRLLHLAQTRSVEAGYNIDFRVGSAVALPWANESMQVCLAVELLEHVSEWEKCLSEFCRVLAPGGILFASTTNALCPVQQEFTLPLYSWYPASVKRYYERLAVTTRPELANHAKYPAVHWFTFYELKAFLQRQGFDCHDRFDTIDPQTKGTLGRAALLAIRLSPIVRFIAYVATEGTSVVAVKRRR